MSDRKHQYTSEYTNTGRQLRSLGAIYNPIENELRNIDYLYLNTFQGLPLIPPFGFHLQPSYATLLWLIDLERISPTHSACIEAKQRMCFDGFIDVIKAPDTMFWRPEYDEQGYFSNISEQEREAFIDGVKSIDMPYSNHLSGLTEKVYRNWESSGNAYVLLKFYSNYTKLEAIDSQHCLYVRQTDDSDVQTIAVADSFLYSDLGSQLENIECYPVSTYRNGEMNLNTKQLDDGSEATIFHLKSGRVGRHFYGEPLWLAAMRYMYGEFQDITYKTKEQERGYLGQLILEVSGGMSINNDLPEYQKGNDYDMRNIPPYNPKQDLQVDPFDEMNRALNELFRNDGTRSMSVALMERVDGDKPMTYLHLPANTNADFYKAMNELQEEKILQAHGISKVFLGGETAASGLGGNAFIDEFKVRDVSVFQPLQQIIASFVNTCLDACFFQMGRPELTQYSIKYRSKYQRMIDLQKQEEDATNS